MGLDMYVYEITRPKYDENESFTTDELKDCMLIPLEEMETPAHKDLLPYCQKLKIKAELFDNKRFMQENGFDKVYGCRYTADGITTYYAKDKSGNDITRTFTEDDFEKYRFTERGWYYVCKEREVCYWRKHYGLEHFFCEKYPIENLGYYKLTKEVIDEANRKFYAGIPVLEESKTKALFYSEWY